MTTSTPTTIELKAQSFLAAMKDGIEFMSRHSINATDEAAKQAANEVLGMVLECSADAKEETSYISVYDQYGGPTAFASAFMDCDEAVYQWAYGNEIYNVTLEGGSAVIQDFYRAYGKALHIAGQI